MFALGLKSLQDCGLGGGALPERWFPRALALSIWASTLREAEGAWHWWNLWRLLLLQHRTARLQQYYRFMDLWSPIVKIWPVFAPHSPPRSLIRLLGFLKINESGVLYGSYQSSRISHQFAFPIPWSCAAEYHGRNHAARKRDLLYPLYAHNLLVFGDRKSVV